MDDQKGLTQQDILRRFRDAPMRMPRSQREVFDLLAFYTPEASWEDFFRIIDFSDVTPAQILAALLERTPASVDEALAGENYSARDFFRQTLLSPAFRRNIQTAFLRAYPEKARDIFIHVPKCAGTDLALNLCQRMLPLPKVLEVEGWVSEDEFLEIVAGLARAVPKFDRLFAYGHMSLGEYVARPGVRPHDRIFTVIRDPIDLLVSQANYAVGRLRKDPLGHDPDTAAHLKSLGLTRLPENASRQDLKDMTIAMMVDRSIVQPDRACFYLGHGSRRCYASAMENLIIHNVEITTTERYDRWLNDRWGISRSARHNRSEPIITNVEARRYCSDALSAASGEDQKLFDVVTWALEKSGKASVTGQEIAQLVGPSLIHALPKNVTPDILREAHDTTAEANILVAEGPERVAMFLAPVSLSLPGYLPAETIFSADFGAEGQGAQYRVSGWANVEPNFTWTAAEESLIRLPRPTVSGDFVFRLVVNPFVNKTYLPAQEVEIFLNDRRLGGCKLHDVSVIECIIPGDVMRSETESLIRLKLPTASCPRKLTGANDDRLLALAVRNIALLQLVSPNPPAVPADAGERFD